MNGSNEVIHSINDDRGFLDALNTQFESFFGLDKIREVLDRDDYLQVRAAIAKRPIGRWRSLAPAAIALSQGGMDPADIATYGLDAVDRICSSNGSRWDLMAELVAEIAATYGLRGERIRTVERVIQQVGEIGGFR